MAEGWIKLHRLLLENCTFQNPDLLKVWIWCLLKATHCDRTQMVGFQNVELHEGEFVFGRKKAAEELRMNESKVYRLINILGKLEKVHIKSSSKFSVVTIENWQLYQGCEQESEQQNEQEVNNKRTTSEQQVNTNKNVKNLKNEKNVKNDNKILYLDCVRLTDDEYQKAVDKYGLSCLQEMIQILNDYKMSSGKKYKSDYYTFNTWVYKRWQDDKGKCKQTSIDNFKQSMESGAIAEARKVLEARGK